MTPGPGKFSKVEEILSVLQTNGIEALVFGSNVRDRLLGREPRQEYELIAYCSYESLTKVPGMLLEKSALPNLYKIPSHLTNGLKIEILCSPHNLRDTREVVDAKQKELTFQYQNKIDAQVYSAQDLEPAMERLLLQKPK